MLHTYIENYMLYHRMDTTDQIEILRGVVFLMLDNSVNDYKWQDSLERPVITDKKLIITLLI